MTDQTLDPENPHRFATFDGQVAVITGGSQGLGYASAELMKARGAAGLVLVGRDNTKGEAAAAALSGDGCRAIFQSVDLRDDGSVDVVVARTDAEFGTVHSFVNCAAATWRGTVWNTDGAMWDEMLGLNVKMPALFVSGLARIMKREGVPDRSTGVTKSPEVLYSS